MAIAKFLADKSAVARIHLEPVRKILVPLVEAGLVATCGVPELEILYSARNGDDHEALRTNRSREYEWLESEDDDFHRAIEVQSELAGRGRHRKVAIADLMIAAVAERHRVTVLHYDADFDLIAEVTGQRTEWVVPRGTV